MIVTRYTFETRKNELASFLSHLAKIQELSEFSPDFSNMLHSNALLMLYNMVEAIVVGGIVEIYDAVKSQGQNYRLVSSNIKDIWFEFKFKQVYDPNAHHNSYKRKASQIIEAILNDQVIELDRNAINAEGNLTAQIIRNICSAHGISFIAPPESNGGVKIDEVTALRNDLAHGGKSFVECGRDFTLSDLEKITDEIIKFLEGLLDGMDEYHSNRKWEDALSAETN